MDLCEYKRSYLRIDPRFSEAWKDIAEDRHDDRRRHHPADQQCVQQLRKLPGHQCRPADWKARAWFPLPISRVDLQYQAESYVPILQKMDSIRQNSARASLSWRLTTREKEGIVNAI